jgi:hypothetical protein
MSQKPEIGRTVPENPRSQGLNEEAIRNFQLSIANGTATKVDFVDGKQRLLYRR